MYREASRILSQVQASKGTIKTLCYASRFSNKAALLGLVSETAKHLDLLEEVIERSGIKWKMDGMLLCVLLMDQFRDMLECGAGLKELILSNKTRLHAEWVKAKLRRSVQDERSNISFKYARVNTLKEGFDFSILNKATPEVLIPNLFCLPSDFPMTHPSIQSGHLIVQDKASCLPPVVLAPTVNDVVIDACAAPGNKTNLLSGMMKDSGAIFAFEKDQRRFKTLLETLDRAACQNVRPECKDFLSVNPNDYPQVTMIMLDPSCSGSGMPLDLERQLSKANDTERSTERLEKLSAFQKKLLRHAMSFRGCKRIVYSTCSIHEIENERVIEEVLSECGKEWRAVEALPGWSTRGAPGFPFSTFVLRADPQKDRCHGFFVACLERSEFNKNG